LAAQRWYLGQCTKREEQISELRKLTTMSSNKQMSDYASECLRIFDNSIRFESVLSTDCEFLSHYRNWNVATTYWSSPSLSEKQQRKVEDFDISLFESLSLWIDSFYKIKAP